MLKDGKFTYISLFSSAGVGCYGFKLNNFECIATNEFIERRLEVQKFNNKCSLDSGYICGDITKDSTKQMIFDEIKKWNKKGNDTVDVVIATPPCQGMSVANHKKADNEIVRNSLVVESIQIINKIKPRIFIFENVAAFMKTGCTAPNGEIKAIRDVIENELSKDYIFTSKVLNFKNYGSNSSRTRTLVIGVNKELSNFLSPIELYPNFVKEKTLREVIGDLPELKWGEICSSDFYHAFRTYPEHMREWIRDLKEGESAFDNEEIQRQPHQIINGEIVLNAKKNGDKYTRQFWDKIGPCIHTRNDQLASQNTVHPTQDRVFSIRELMNLMTIPKEFKWNKYSLEELNSFDLDKKLSILKQDEIKIRQSIGEAVPTSIFYQIAYNIKNLLIQKRIGNKEITNMINKYKLEEPSNMLDFIKNNDDNINVSSLSRIAELSNYKRESNEAYYTNKFLVHDIIEKLPVFDKEVLHILEPSVGVGNFLPLLFKKYDYVKKVCLDVVDIDERNIEILKAFIKKIGKPNNFTINYIVHDFLTLEENRHYDLVIGNPPFDKLKSAEAKKYLINNINKNTTNTFEFFLEKAIRISDYVTMITPKSILNTPEFADTRKMLKDISVYCIEDFGEKGFEGVLVETICLFVSVKEKPKYTFIKSMTLGMSLNQKQNYIMDEKLPYWIIYRNDFFDKISAKMDFNLFEVFRDRQITNSNTTYKKLGNSIRVLKSRNISDDGKNIINIEGYDSYIDSEQAKNLSVYKYYNNDSVYLTPNMTYNPRVMRNPKDVLVNGSVAILIPKTLIGFTDEQLSYFSTEEYRNFYKIARNYQTRSLNVDSTSVYFYGIIRRC